MSSSLLDLSDVVQRASTWRFDLVDQNLENPTEIQVFRDSVAQLRVDVSRSVKRTLTGIELPHGSPHYDAIKNRLKLTMILQDESEWPLGIFIFADESRHVLSGLDISAVHSHSLSALDQLLIVDQESDHTISFGPGASVSSAILQVLDLVPVNAVVEDSPTVINSEKEAIAWPTGTSLLKIINELGKMAGFHELYFDHAGNGFMGPAPSPDATPFEEVLNYTANPRVYRSSVTRSTNQLELPNRFIVSSNGANDSPVTGTFDIPDFAPHSIANRGFVITHTEQMQGIESQSDAENAAKELAKDWRFPYETIEFSGPPDPRHDHFNTIDFQGVRYLELSWSMPLQEGAEMRHVIRRVYEQEGLEL